MPVIYGLSFPELAIPPTPEWLQRRGGLLRRNLQSNIVEVWLEGQPLYRLEVRPARNQYTCVIVDMTSARPISNGSSIYATTEQALAGGLEQLRGYLGW
jgi:hypothetical protein